MPTATFQDGTSYSGTIDTTLQQAKPDVGGGTWLNLFVDAGTGVQQQGLLEFTNLFGDGPGQIPIGSTITSATLTLSVGDGSTKAGNLYRMITGWDENSTWNSMGNGIQIGVETASNPDLALGAVAAGTRAFNVTSSVQAWLSGATTADQANAANDGWLFNSTSTDGWKFASSEGGPAPILTVTYTAPPPPPQLAMHGPVSLGEGTSSSPTSFVFTVDRTGDTSGSVSVNYSVTGSGTNLADASDFSSGVLPSGTVTFAPGQTSQTITINVAGDSIVENDEGFTVTLSNPTNGGTITGATTTGTIVNDDLAQQLAMHGPVSLSEGTSSSPTSFVFTIDRTGDTSGSVSVNYGVTGSGTNPADASDFSLGVLPSGTVTFAAGQTSQTITVNVAGDTVVENNEDFTVTLSSATSGATITGATTTGTIVNDDLAQQLAMHGPVSLSEGTSSSPTSFVFTIDRTGDTSAAVSVDYGVIGSGTNPADASDFSLGVLPSGTVTFAAGQTSQTITINVAGDAGVEADENFLLTLSNPTNGATITGATATGTIVNDDTAPTGPVTTTFQQGGTYTGTLDTTLNEAKANTIAGNNASMTVDAGTGTHQQSLLEFGDLFGTGPGQIPIGATITSAVLTLNVTNASGSGGTVYRMASNWDESSTWNSLGNGVQLGTETAASPDLTLGKVAIGAQTFNVTSSLQAWLSGAATAADANTANHGWVFNTTSTDAWVFNSSEGATAPSLVVTYTMGPPPGPPQLALAGPVSANEGTSESPTSLTFTVNRTGDASSAVSVKYAVTGTGTDAAKFSDFTGGVLPSGTVNFAAGETSKTIVIKAVGDTSVENNETFLVTLSNPTNGASISGATATGTIVNDDLSDGLRGVHIIPGSNYGNGDPNSTDHYGSTDPTDIAHAADGTFYLVDSEVDETPLFGTVNMWHLDSYGNLIAPVTLESFTHEPTGIAAWLTPTGAQHLFITDDDQQKIFEIDAANPTVVLNSFLTTSFGCVDPEDITINPNNGNLFVMSENDHKIYEITQSGTKVATTTLPNTFVPHTDPLSEDAGAEAIAYDPVKDVFWVTGGFSPDIFEVSRSGQILNMINVLEQYPNPSLVGTPQGVYLKGLELAPSSDGSGHLSLWVTDYGRDQYPDGRVFEILLPDLAPGASVATASSMANQAIALPHAPAPDHALLQPGTHGMTESSDLHGRMGPPIHDWVHEWASVHDTDFVF